MSFRQTEPLLQIGGREDLPAEGQSLQAGHVVLEDARHTLCEFFAFGVPAAAPQRVGCILDQDRHHVLPRRGEIRIHDRRQGDVEERVGRCLSILRVVVCPFDVFERRAHAEVGWHAVPEKGQSRNAVESEIHFRDDPVHLEVSDMVEEFGTKLLGLDKMEERPLRVRIRRDHAGADCLAASQFDAGDTSLSAHDPRHFRLRPNRHAGIPRRQAERVRQGAHAAPHERRGGAVDIRPEMGHESERRARRPGSFIGPDQRIDREVRLEQFCLEPFVQEVPD